MKLTVTKFLNVRVGAPSVNAPCYQYLAPGSEIETDGNTYKGDLYKDIDTWVRDVAGNYYWSGGVLVQQEPSTSIKETSHYDEFINQFGGNTANIGIALLDSGVNGNHPFLNGLLKHNQSYLPGNSMQDMSSHGNRVAGILASTDPGVKRNQSSLYSFRVADSNNSIDSNAVQNALLEIKNNMMDRIDIINMSIDILYDDVAILQPIINFLSDKGILVVVAAGENNYLNNTAFLQNVIRIATFDEHKTNAMKTNGLKTEYSNIFLNKPIASYSFDGRTLDATIDQDSGYCAVVSSLLARWVSSSGIGKTKIRIINAETFLKSISRSIKADIIIKPFKPYI